MTETRRAVVLVGHGTPPADAPPELVPRLKKLESERRRSRGPMTAEEKELDARIRSWPRSAANDPYRLGVEKLAAAMREALPGLEVVIAYNELCAPSLEDALVEVASRGARHVVVVPTMLTRGGVHSEVEIPEAIAHVRAQLPEGTRVEYAWPFAEADVAALLASGVRAAFAR